jgi:hypothetical protein
MNIGDRVRSNKWWNDRSRLGPFRGELAEIVPRGTHANAPLRTHRVKLDKPFEHYRSLTFDPRDLELEGGDRGQVLAALLEVKKMAELLLVDLREDGVEDRHCREVIQIIRTTNEVLGDQGRGQEDDTSNG